MTVLGPDAAVVNTTSESNVVFTDGTVGDSFAFVQTFIWTKEDTGWKVLQAHQSSRPLSQETAE